MFIYEFQSANCLLRKVLISGPTLTIYTSKPNLQEFQAISRYFQLRSIRFAEDPRHNFCHNPYVSFSAQGDSIPHKHYKLPEGVNKASYVEAIFHYLIENQSNISLRKEAYDQFIKAL